MWSIKTIMRKSIKKIGIVIFQGKGMLKRKSVSLETRHFSNVSLKKVMKNINSDDSNLFKRLQNQTKSIMNLDYDWWLYQVQHISSMCKVSPSRGNFTHDLSKSMKNRRDLRQNFLQLRSEMSDQNFKPTSS